MPNCWANTHVICSIPLWWQVGGVGPKKIKDLNLVNQSPRVLEIKLRSQLHLTTPTSAKIESRIVKNNINRSPRLPPNLPCSRLPLLPIHHLIAQFLFCNDCVAIPIKNQLGGVDFIEQVLWSQLTFAWEGLDLQVCDFLTHARMPDHAFQGKELIFIQKHLQIHTHIWGWVKTYYDQF